MSHERDLRARKTTSFTEFTPEIKNDCSFGDTIPATVYQHLIGSNPIRLVYWGRTFGRDNINIAIVGLPWVVNFDNRIRVRFGDSTSDGLSIESIN